jgi:hypothetical protein
MMETIFHSPSGLYPKLLGDSWYTLNDAIRRLHGSGATVHTVGLFQVRHGSNPLARMLAWLTQLPAQGEAVNVRLLVTARKNGEEWRRTFAGHPLVSMQSRRPDSAMVANLLPALWHWWSLPTALAPTTPAVPEPLRWVLAVMAAGVFLSGTRDLYAALGPPHGGWPWVVELAEGRRRP